MNTDPVLRVSTGKNHNEAIKVFTDIETIVNIMMEGSSPIDNIDIIHRMIQTLINITQFLGDPDKNNKQFTYDRLNQKIASFNKKITFLRGQNKIYHQIPTINTKPRSAKGKKLKLLQEGTVTYPIPEKDNVYTPISLCSSRNTLCLTMDKDDITNFLIPQLEKTDDFIIYIKSLDETDILIDVFHKQTFNFVLKSVCMKCPTCKNKKIKLATFWTYVKPEKKITGKNINVETF